MYILDTLKPSTIHAFVLAYKNMYKLQFDYFLIYYLQENLVVRDHCHNRLKGFKDHKFLASDPTFHHQRPPVLRSHILLFND